ncbi:ankyrin repeat domain-containing protein [Candidatus Babeliales bacterium]|nr:ankyrin repeat domain-containing protein [Candidatus Babeliales bacterium]
MKIINKKLIGSFFIALALTAKAMPASSSAIAEIDATPPATESRFLKKLTKFLKDPNNDPNNMYYNGTKAIYRAAKKGNLKALKMLLAHPRTNVNIVAYHGEDKGLNALLLAVENDHTECVQELLKKENISLDVRDNDGLTPVHYAVHNNNLATLSLLLERGANPNLKPLSGPCTGLMPLHMATKNNNHLCMQKLLEHGAKVNAKTRNKLTTLHLATDPEKDPRCAELLIMYGASLNTLDKNNQTPLHYAAKKGNIACTQQILMQAKKLKTLDATVNVQDAQGATPLHWAANNNHNQLAQILIKNTAHIDAQDNNKSTPLHLATRRNSIACLRLLLKKGALLDARDRHNHTAFYYARGLCRLLIAQEYHKNNAENYGPVTNE